MSTVQLRTFLLVSVGALFVLTISGCGGSGGGGSERTVCTTIAFSNDAVFARDTANLVDLLFRDSSRSPVPIEDIESLTVTVTEIVFQRCDGNDGDEDAHDVATVEVENFEFEPSSVTIEQGGMVRWVWEEDGLHTVTSGAAGDGDAGSLFNETADTEGQAIEIVFPDIGFFPYFSNIESDIDMGMGGSVEVVADGDGLPPDNDSDDTNGNGGQIVVFTGSFDLDLLQLTTLSEVLTCADVPPGRYCKIRFSIENPRLVLVATSPEVFTNVRLTANGHLSIGKKFEIAAGGGQILVIDFGGIHLIDAGSSGMFVLTPQLSADVDVSELETVIEGEIISSDCHAGIVTVAADSQVDFLVMLDSETQLLDASEIEIGCGDLSVGTRVEVQGLLGRAHIIEADKVEIEN